MQELFLPQHVKELPSPLHRVPLSLNKYFLCIQKAGLITQTDMEKQPADEMVYTIFNYADPDERVELFIQEYASQCVIRPDLYIPLLISGYKDPSLHEELLQYDPHIRGNIIGGANILKAGLETKQARFSLGVSMLNELEPKDAHVELNLLTRHISYLHNLNVELLHE